MANKLNLNLTILAAPTHLLIEEDGNGKQRVMYSNYDGLIFFQKGWQPKPDMAYKLIPIEENEAHEASK